MAGIPDIETATRSYERWLKARTKVRTADIRLKHEKMAESPFVFLRATFYRWIALWPEFCAPLADAPRVLAAGDVHVENFGTWRDSEGRLAWGLNDVDEAAQLPYTQDLVRLTTSVGLAGAVGHVRLPPRDICDAILDGYRAALERGGRPIVLAERRRWLRRIAQKQLRDPAAFWKRLLDLKPASGAPVTLLQRSLPAGTREIRIAARVAGAGSLGRQRYVAIGEWDGGLVAREAKALVPSAECWATRRGTHARSGALLTHAVRVPDPFFKVHQRWIVRRLAPDCARIEVADLPGPEYEVRLLRAMGWEVGNLHVRQARAEIRRDLRSRKGRWLQDAARAMADLVIADWKEWRNSRRVR